jgi:hypothetical protein
MKGKGRVPSGDPKFKTVMQEFGKGDLHSGSPSGPKVTNPKQAVAIAVNSTRRKARGRKGGK